MESFVLSIIGADQSGLVEALSQVVVDHGGSWERSQLTELAGVFAGVALVSLPPANADAFREALVPLRDHGLLDVTLHRTAAPLPDDTTTVTFDVVGADRPGIVHDVAELLASLGIGIVDLVTWVEPAAVAGGDLFRAAAVVRIPSHLTRDDLTDALEGLPDNLMVDLAEQ